MVYTLETLQNEQREWADKNFPTKHEGGYHSLLGVMEELGELAHAHLKGLQGIRHTPAEIVNMKRDAVGDIVIFLADYCTRNDIDFHTAVWATWDQVKQRNWTKNKETGVCV